MNYYGLKIQLSEMPQRSSRDWGLNENEPE